MYRESKHTIAIIVCLVFQFNHALTTSLANSSPTTSSATGNAAASLRSIANFTIANVTPSVNVSIVKEEQPTRCLLPKNRGICRAHLFRYHYDPEINECVEFLYGGCDGNDNRFMTNDECEKTCHRDPHTLEAGVMDEKPDKCSLPVHRGVCKSRLYRYYYDPEINECVEFLYRGCGGNDNRFFTKVACEQVCYRVKQTTKPRTLDFTCTLLIQALDKCQLTSDISRIASCGSLPFDTKDPKQCVASGCCWHHSYKICYNYVAENIRNARCQILYKDNKGFFGVGSFRTVDRYPHGWAGYVTFSTPVTGDFCMAKDKHIPQKVIIGEKFLGNRGIVLQGTRGLFEGHITTLTFIGSFGNSRFSQDACETPPVVRKKTTA